MVYMDKNRSLDISVAVLVFPFVSPSVFAFAEKLALVMSSVTTQTVLISGGIPADIAWPETVQVYDIGLRLHHVKERYPVWFSSLVWLGKVLVAQVLLARALFQLRREIDVVVCSLGCYYQFPVLMSKLLGKILLCASMGLDSLGTKLNYGDVLATLISGMARFNLALSDGVLVESLRLGAHADLASSRHKLQNGALFLEDLESFSAQIPIQKRGPVIGYVGRLVAEKGALEFAQAIPLALGQRPDLRFLIIGTGRLDDALEEFMSGQSWRNRVTWLKWVDHDRIPDYLNQLSLVVIPSYSEGLPNLALEAMGCGTPVLATPVGGIPDVVIDGETGFLLEGNSPDVIAQAIIRAVSEPDLGIIARQAREVIERKYTFDAASRRYQAILHSLSERL